jgi:hypothetical protein
MMEFHSIMLQVLSRQCVFSLQLLHLEFNVLEKLVPWSNGCVWHGLVLDVLLEFLDLLLQLILVLGLLLQVTLLNKSFHLALLDL